MGTFIDNMREEYDKRIKTEKERIERNNKICEERTAQQFLEDFKATPDTVTLDIIIKDGLTFKYHGYQLGASTWRLRGKCSLCGEEGFGQPLSRTALIPYILGEKEFAVEHNCQYSKQEEQETLTTEQQLINHTMDKREQTPDCFESEVYEYKGRGVLKIPLGGGYSMSFGLRKTGAILENIQAIEEFFHSNGERCVPAKQTNKSAYSKPGSNPTPPMADEDIPF